MKFILKRRKHRKGIRPKRKGTLKVRMVKLLSKEQHYQTINKLDNELHPIIMKGIGLGITESEHHYATFLFYSIKKLRKGYDYFEDFNQIDPNKLALRAINEANPIFEGKRQSVCDTCEHKNNCPFSAIPKRILDYACPNRSLAHAKRILKAVRNEPTAVPLTQTEMAELALTHLS